MAGGSKTATATKGGTSISVTRNSNGSYKVNGKNYNSARAATNAVKSIANSTSGSGGSSSSGSGGWTISKGSGYSSGGSTGGSTGGSSGGSSGSSYRGAGGSGLTSTDWGTKYADNANIQSAIAKYGKDKVYDALDYISGGGKSNSQISYLLTGNPNSTTSLGGSSAATTNPNVTGDESGISSTRKLNGIDYTSSSVENFLNAKDHYKQQGFSEEDAHNKAKAFLELPSITTTKQEEEAKYSAPDTSDEDELITNETPYVGEEEAGDNEEGYNEYDELVNEFNRRMDEQDAYYRDIIDQLKTPTTESTVVENTAKVDHDPAFDFQTYFNENLSGDQDVGETGAVKNKIEQGPLSDVTKYDEETTSALEYLGFLEPNQEASESMPDTVEQTPVQTFETPEQLMEGYSNKLDELANEEQLDKRTLAQTYMDYRNMLNKYVRDNNLSKEQAAEMFAQLKQNPRFMAIYNGIQQ